MKQTCNHNFLLLEESKHWVDPKYGILSTERMIKECRKCKFVIDLGSVYEWDQDYWKNSEI